MIHRSTSGQTLGSGRPQSQVVDPSCWSDTKEGWTPRSANSSSSAPNHSPASQPETANPAGKLAIFRPFQNFLSALPRSQAPSNRTDRSTSPSPDPGVDRPELEPLPTFPSTLFQFRNYDGAKALTALLLTLSTLYFLAGFVGFLFDHTPWLKSLLPTLVPAPIAPPAEWWQIWKPVGAAVGHIASYVDLAFRMFVFLCTYCLAWATFDSRNIEGYVMGFFNTCLGLAYLISPIDAIPDFIPVAGGLDDAVLGLGVLLVGVSSIYRNRLRDVRTNTILALIDGGNRPKALQMLLEDKGIRVNESAIELPGRSFPTLPPGRE